MESSIEKLAKEIQDNGQNNQKLLTRKVVELGDVSVLVSFSSNNNNNNSSGSLVQIPSN